MNIKDIQRDLETMFGRALTQEERAALLKAELEYLSREHAEEIKH